jgi:hypothetical protein
VNAEIADALLRELLRHGLLSAAGAVDGNVLAVPERERRWFRFFEKNRRQLFVRAGGPAYAREGALYEKGFDFLPPLRIDDRDNELLVIETFNGAYDIVEFHRTSRRVAEWLPALIGRALATLHAAAIDSDAFPRDLPPLLQSTANAAPAVAQAIARVAASWTGTALLHGDFDFDRILIAPNERRIHLVAFDEARIGDPAWDAAGVIEAYYAWALEPRLVSDVEGPVCPLPTSAMTAAIASFWTTYTAALALPAAEARVRLIRAFAYAGVRMLAHVERMQRKPEPTGPWTGITQMMQAALSLMTSPAAAVDVFFVPPRPAWPQQSWGQW